MDDHAQFQRLAAISAILAAPVALGSAALSVAAVGGNTQAYIDYSLSGFAPGGAEIYRWAMVTDVFGYYLLLGPLALVLHDWLKPRAPNLVRLYTLCGLGFVLIGAIGAIVLSAVVPRLVSEYASAAAPRQEVLEVVFRAFYDMVDRGLWNPLEMILASVWWLGIGLALRRERAILGLVTIVVGAAALLDAVGRIFGIEALYQAGVGGIFILVPAWAAWSSIDLLRKPVIYGTSA
jgi:hypothetical protein